MSELNDDMWEQIELNNYGKGKLVHVINEQAELIRSLHEQLTQAHRAGWAQCQRDAVKAAKYSHHPESCFCDWCAIAHKASDDVAAMTYKEPTNEK